MCYTVCMAKEGEPSTELDPHLVAAYADTFIPRFDLYPLQLQDGTYTIIKHTLHADLLTVHVRGFITLGAYALDSESRAKWVCFDADDSERWERLIQFASILATDDVPAYLEPSRRGGHLWLFFAPRGGQDTRRFGKQLLAEYGLSGVELYPKQDALQSGPGSLVRLPLGKHRLTGKRYHFITPSGEPLAPTIRAQLAALAEPQHVPQTFLEAVLARAPAARPVSPTPPFQERPARRKKKRSKRQEKPSERIKAAISVLAFVQRYVTLDEQGRGHCPFHPDEHKSFAVNAPGNYWHCFAGCGGGSVIDFWMRWRKQQGEDASFSATLSDLARQLLE